MFLLITYFIDPLFSSFIFFQLVSTILYLIIISHYHIRPFGYSVNVSFMLFISFGLRVATQLNLWPFPLLSDPFGICSGLGIYSVVRQCLVILYVGSGFFNASQLAP